MLVMRILQISNYDAGRCYKQELFKTWVQMDRVNNLAAVADTVI